MRINKLFLRWITVFGMVMMFAISGWGAGDGLTGSYYKKNSSTYSNYPISGTPNLTRTDSTVNFNWDTGNPGIGQNDYYQAKWTGYVYIPTAGSWTFYTSTDDGVKLSIDGALQIDHWVDQAPTEYSKTLTLTAGYHAIQMDYYENGGGAVARLYWSGPSVSKAIIPQNNLYTVAPTALSISNATLIEGDSGTTNMNFTVTLSSSTNVSVNYATSDGTATASNDYSATSGTLTFTAGGVTTQTISVPIISDTLMEGDETFTVTLSNATGGVTIGNATATGKIIDDDNSYCKSAQLSSGYHIVTPDGNVSHSFEIYCDRSNPSDIKDVLKLPISKEMKTTEFSNFKFNASLGSSANYYDDANTKTYFNYLRINAKTLQIIPDTTSGFFDGSFSNINLRGTPFTLDWDHMSASDISGCTLSSMRRDYDNSSDTGGQILKINPKSENVYQCSSSTLKMKLLSDYKYVVYNGSEALKKSCKELSEALPASGQYANMTGYFYIDPKQVGRNGNQSLSDYRPFVTYCMEVAGTNAEDQYAWTMFLNLDGVRTENHSDIANGKDTCSNLGLFFFVPNSKITFNKVRTFLFNQKAQWEPYTGTMGEYFTDRNINGWGKSYETSRHYWPYGPMGLYYDDGSSSDGILDPGSAGSWTPITNGVSVASKTYGYDLTSDSNVNGTSINIAHINTGTGFKTTLEEMGYPADFWITDLSAGNFANSAPVCSGGNTSQCYLDGSRSREPNGDYTYGNWLHFWADDNGWIYHYNDQGYAGTINDRYRHDHYMCIAEDNYQFVSRYALVDGPFNVVEHGATLSGTGYKSAKLSTKVANETMRFDVVLLKDDLSDIRGSSEEKRSYGLFLDDTYMDGFTETAEDIYYFGDNENNFQSLGTRFELTAPYWGGTETWPNASKRLFFNFKYCSQTNMKWTDCWTLSGNTATCKAGSSSYCKTANSNDFAVRPKQFSISNGTTVKAGNAFQLNMFALDYLDNNTTGYNEAVASTFDVSVAEHKASTGCILGTFKNDITTGWQFDNGKYIFVDQNYSEVGEVDVNITEENKPCSQRFAAIDCNDTALTTLTIPTYSRQLVFTPDHFNVSAKIFNVNNGKFTYLSNPYATSTKDFSMSGRLDLNITAKNAFDGNTTNYNTSCYAKAKDIHLTYTPTTITNLHTLYTQYLHDSTVIGDINHTNNGTSLSILNVPKDIFTVDHKSMAILHLNLNFDRNHTATVNKFDFNSSQIQVNTADEVNATVTPTGGVTFVYGRFAPRDVRVFGSKPFTASGWYEVYNAPILSSTILPPSKNTVLWYTNTLHNDDIHGNANVTFVLPNTMAVPANSDMLDPPLGAGIETYTFGGGVVPYSGKAHVDINPWLWFGEAALGYADPGTNVDGTVDVVDDTDCFHHPCFNINVVPDIGRAGSATGTELRSDKANKATRTKGVHYDYTPATR